MVTPGKEATERRVHFLMGQVMRKTQGRADPHRARALLIERLIARLQSTEEESHGRAAQ